MASDSYSIRTFVLWLIFKVFYWDIICAILFAILIEFFEFSTSYFIKAIIEIPDIYPNSNRYLIFLGYAGVMIVFKILGSIISQYTTFYIVIL